MTRSTVRGCDMPSQLYYQIEHNIWLRMGVDSLLTLGMTSYACSLAGEIVALTTKKPGKALRQDQSCATVESGKWVGPVKVSFNCEIVAVNEAAILDPRSINNDPYGEGWIALLKPEDWLIAEQSLVTGEQALQAMEAKMEQDGFGGC